MCTSGLRTSLDFFLTQLCKTLDIWSYQKASQKNWRFLHAFVPFLEGLKMITPGISTHFKHRIFYFLAVVCFFFVKKALV